MISDDMQTDEKGAFGENHPKEDDRPEPDIREEGVDPAEVKPEKK